MKFLAVAVALILLGGCNMSVTEKTLTQEVFNCERAGAPGAIVVITRIPRTDAQRARNIYTVTCVGT